MSTKHRSAQVTNKIDPENVQIITNERGAPAFAVLPWDRYLALVDEDFDAEEEEAADVAALRAAMAEDDEGLPDALVGRLIDGEHPIRVWRHHRGMTQSTLAEKIGIKPAYLSQIETGKRTGSLDLHRRVAKALGVHIDDLVE